MVGRQIGKEITRRDGRRTVGKVLGEESAGKNFTTRRDGKKDKV